MIKWLTEIGAELLTFWWPILALATLGLILQFGDMLVKWADENNIDRRSAFAQWVGRFLQWVTRVGFYFLVAAFFFIQCNSRSTSGIYADTQECERLPSIYGC
jgi:hypothetical protein